MAKYRLEPLAVLARQLLFTPSHARVAQLADAESLLHEIDPTKAYPQDFVIFRITGFQPKTEIETLLTGLALQHDLGLYIDQISNSLNISAIDLTEPVLTIDDVTARFNVTSKTIQRWRRKGLPARRFIFPDGKRRVGFLLSSVERFLTKNNDQVRHSANFSLIDADEHQEILRRARRLARHCRCDENEITRRIGRRLNRSPMAILHTLRKHDQLRPEQAILQLAPGIASPEVRLKVLKLHRRGLAFATIAGRIKRTRSAIYRIILDDRLDRLMRRKIKFIDDPLYHTDDAELTIDALADQEELSPVPAGPETRAPRDLPAHLLELYRTPLLSVARERGLFLKFNYHKYRFAQARRRVEPESIRMRDLRLLESIRRQVCETKNEIVRANLRLVVSVARKHLRSGLNLMELVSDGYVTLMRAAESFDIHRGNRFSTYATFALMKGYARSVPMMQTSQRLVTGGDRLGQLPDERQSLVATRLLDREQVQQMLLHLDEHERTVILGRFGLADSAPVTVKQLARTLGISKDRVRQIEQGALTKLRMNSM